MEVISKMLSNISIPRVYKVKYHIESHYIKNISEELISQLKTTSVLSQVHRGQRIAITVGSRGITNQVLVVKTLIDQLKKVGAEPFVITAMGSHAGANARNQKAMIEGLGFTENYLGVPIKSTMEVVEIGTTFSGLPVYIDKYAYEADGVILLNRVKFHTSFQGPVESGILKMGVIGLGNQKGAEICHELGFEGMSQRILEIAKVIIKRVPVLFGVAIIEDGQHQTAEIHVLPHQCIENKELQLLRRAKNFMVQIPFKSLEVLVIDQIGKDISGTGLDTNVVGRYHTGHCSGGPDIKRISILDISDGSNGNGHGLGIADFTTQRVYKKYNFAETYPNALTSNVPVSAKIPMVLPSDRYCIQAALKTCLLKDKKDARMVRIKDTLSLREIEVSENMRSQIESHSRLEIIQGPYELSFNEDGNLIPEKDFSRRGK